ncbi:MAG: D-alanyl-D-alanine carboxypeptidase [Anaerolineae bacterium]
MSMVSVPPHDRRPLLVQTFPGSRPRLLSLVLLVFLAGVGHVPAAELPFQTLARSVVGTDQGVFVLAEDGTVLAALNADRAVHPASITKIATTLALLRRLGPEHRFETRFLARSPLRDGTLQGNLIVEGEDDPYLVFENAFLILLELRAHGIRTVQGTLKVRGSLLFNWRPDPQARRLQRALAGLDGAAGWRAVQAVRKDAAAMRLAAVALKFNRAVTASTQRPRLLLTHRSPPLLRHLKDFNCYSNNIFHALSRHIGGPAVVERISRDSVLPTMRSAIVIDNAAGVGKTNRLSPQATVALLQALNRELVRHGISFVDVLPVAGVDPGTLEDRFDDPSHQGIVVGKTGTLRSLGISALAGLAQTQRYGRVIFAVLNHSLPVREARRRQDAFVRALLDASGAVPQRYRREAGPAFTEARLEASR